MKILVSDNLILDTEADKLETGNKSDIEKKGQAVIYKIQRQGLVFYCNICFKGKILANQEYDKIKNYCKSKNISYYEVTEEHIIPDSIRFLCELRKGLTRNIEVTKSVSKVNRGKIEGYSTSEAEDEEIYKNNILDYQKRTANTKELKELPAPEMKDAARNQILTAKRILKNNYPFYYCVLKNLEEIYVDNNSPYKTLAVNSTSLLVNVDYVMKKRIPQLVFILAHEAGHVIFKHLLRLRGRNGDMWNYAGDLVINKILCEDFGIEPGKGNDIVEMSMGVYDSDLDTKNETAETVYDKIWDESFNQKPPKGPQPPGPPTPPPTIEDQIIEIYNKIKKYKDNPINIGVKAEVEKELSACDSLVSKIERKTYYGG